MKPNDTVSFTETYYTSAKVLARRVVWGRVIDIYEHPGDRDGHIFKGVYVQIRTVGGDTVVVMFDDINTVMP